MAELPTIHLIHASDAPQHSGKLKEILQKLKAENRISDFVTLSTDDQLANLMNQAKNSDLVLTLLTYELEPRQAEIEKMLRTLRNSHPDLKVAEVIVDHVPYENDFITFPSDLKPVRDRNDMDTVWTGIEQNMKDMFPVETIQEEPHNGHWKKYLKYAIPIIVLGLIVWLAVNLVGGNKPEAAFRYKVWDSESNDLIDTAACYAPCIVYFDNESRNYDSLVWDFGDTTLAGEEDPKYLFFNPGEHTIVLHASAGSKENTFEKTLLVKAPPYADFEVPENGCIAPCEVTFSNNSENATSYTWEFGDSSSGSNEKNPKKLYQTQGEYQVKLTATNQDGMKADTVKTVTIREDDSPFAEFKIKKSGRIGTTPRKVTFENLSQNADQYIWNFGDGRNAVTNSNAPNAQHTYDSPGSYTVVLTAKQNNRESTAANEFYVGPNENKFKGTWKIQSEALERINKSPQLKKQLQDASIQYKIQH